MIKCTLWLWHSNAKQGIQKDGIMWKGKTKEALVARLNPKLLQAHLWLQERSVVISTSLYHKHPVPIGTKYLLKVFNHRESYKPPALCVCTSMILFMSPDYQGNKQRALLWSGIIFLKWNIKALISMGRKKSTICLSLFLTLSITHVHFKLLEVQGIMCFKAFRNALLCWRMKKKPKKFCPEP